MSSTQLLPATEVKHGGVLNFIGGKLLGLGSVPQSSNPETMERERQELEELREFYLKVERILRKSMLIEYTTALLVFLLACGGHIVSSALLQAIYMFGVCLVESAIYMRCGEAFEDETLLGIKLGIPAWWIVLLAEAPNCIQVLATATTVGIAFSAWSTPKVVHSAFPLLAFLDKVFGADDIATQLGCLVILGSLFHYFFGLLGGHVLRRASSISELHSGIAELCDAADMQFAGRALRALIDDTLDPAPVHFEDMDLQFTRLLLFCLIKTPMLWLQTELLSTSYDDLSSHELLVVVTSTTLTWYGALQLLWCSAGMSWRLFKH